MRLFDSAHYQKQILDATEGRKPIGSLIKDLEDSLSTNITAEDKHALLELSNRRYNLLTWACYNGHLGLIKFLVEKYNADIFINCCRGDTPLIASIQRRNFNCVRYLLKRGADPNMPNLEGNYPLGEAYLRCYVPYFDIFRLLIKFGADINKGTMVDSDTIFKPTEKGEAYMEPGDGKVIKYLDLFEPDYVWEEFWSCAYLGEYEHPLIYSAINDKYKLFEYISKHPHVSTETKIKGFELLGASRVFKDKGDDAIQFWKVAWQLRLDSDVISSDPADIIFPKQVANPQEVYMHIAEINSYNELVECSRESLFLRIQAHLIVERTLPTHHRDYILALGQLRTLYIERNRFDLAIKVDIKTQIACHEGAQNKLCPFSLYEYDRSIYEMLDILESKDWTPTFAERFQACEQTYRLLLCSHLFYQQFSAPPFDTCGPPSMQYAIACCLASINYIIKGTKSRSLQENEKISFHRFMSKLISSDFVEDRGQTLLHICLKQITGFFAPELVDYKDNYKLLENLSFDVIYTLLAFGADINAKDKDGNTPLHLVVKFQFENECVERLNESYDVIKLLINKGAHLDIYDNEGFTVTKLITDSGIFCLEEMQLPFPTLKCLAASAVNTHGLSVDPRSVPVEVSTIIKLHQKPKSNTDI